MKQVSGLGAIKEAMRGKQLKSHRIFSDENIQAMFGHEAADDETLSRLKEYYVKGDIYDRLTANLKLRILVGHKGIGKSAMFKIAANEDEQSGTLSVLVKPNDIDEISEKDDDALKNIRRWTNGLKGKIYQLAMNKLGVDGEDKNSIAKSILEAGGRVIHYIGETFKHQNISIDPSKEALRKIFTKNKKINVYIDDLDRGWKGSQGNIAMISALMNAVRDISNEDENIHFKIALRADVYYLFRTSDESTDKVGGSVIWLTWTNHEILVQLVKRVLTFFGQAVDEEVLLQTHQSELSSHLDRIINPIFDGEGHWANAPIYRVLMSLIRKRPRDLVKLCTLAAQHANIRKSSTIQTVDFESIFPSYSHDRLMDTGVEYQSELADINRLMLGMKPSVKRAKANESYTYTTENLLKKISSIAESGRFSFSYSKSPATASQLAQFLYKINFITGRRKVPSGKIVRTYFEENNYLMQEFADFGYSWEVHPAYRWALQPDDPKDIYRRLELIACDEAD